MITEIHVPTHVMSMLHNAWELGSKGHDSFARLQISRVRMWIEMSLR